MQTPRIPNVTILRADGTRLPVRFKVARHATLQPVLLPSRQRWAASMDLSWQNWCHHKPGPLTVRVRLGRRGDTTGPFDGPPADNLVPGCLNQEVPSRLILLDAYQSPLRLPAPSR